MIGAAFLLAFFLYIRSPRARGEGRAALHRAVQNRTSNLALVTQNIQWLLLMGVSFVVSVFLQEVRGYSAIKTGVVFTAATLGILASSFAAERLAKRFPQRTLIVAGFVVTLAGIVLLLGIGTGLLDSVLAFVPGLALVGLGLGGMLTPSVNVVQSSFPEDASGRDLRSLAQRLEPWLLVRHRDRGDDPRIGRRPRHALVRRLDARSHRAWAHRSRGGGAASSEDRTGLEERRLGVTGSVAARLVEPPRPGPLLALRGGCAYEVGGQHPRHPSPWREGRSWGLDGGHHARPWPSAHIGGCAAADRE